MFGNQLHGGTIPDVKEYAAAMAVSIASDDCIVRDKEFSVRYGIVKPSFCKSVNIWAKRSSMGTEDVHLGQQAATIGVHKSALPNGNIKV